MTRRVTDDTIIAIKEHSVDCISVKVDTAAKVAGNCVDFAVQ